MTQQERQAKAKKAEELVLKLKEALGASSEALDALKEYAGDNLPFEEWQIASAIQQALWTARDIMHVFTSNLIQFKYRSDEE